uniref:Uncharacterized protein n=1 Tax=Cajanus cajan TaxID=3821 RepID=A0A151TMF7_CAJCA|nr:hypothetical protein KK1_021851 [Cajanus cajan]
MIYFSSASYLNNWNLYISVSQIKCMETRRAEDIAASYNGSIWKDGESARGSSDGLCTIEIKNALIPPWFICDICALMASEGRSFEARYE